MIYLINAECSTTISNTGMKTVDLAWDVFLKKNNLNLEYKRYSIKLKNQLINISNKHSLNYLNYNNFQNNKPSKNDIIIFWGDFIHSYNYLANDIKRMTLRPKYNQNEKIKSSLRTLRWYTFNKTKSISTILKATKFSQFTEEDYFDKSLNFYLPQDLNTKCKYSISFGTTMLGDNEINLNNQINYLNYLKNFLKNINRIWVREVVTAQHISSLSEDYTKNFLGIDCALLIDQNSYKEFIDESTINIPKEKYMLCHFGRTKTSINSQIELSLNLAKRLNLKLVWIPWLAELNNNRFKDLNLELLKEIEIFSNLTYSNLIHLVLNSNFIMTDTYHLTLVSWRLEKPVSCIGFGTQEPKTTIDDKKKEIFHLIHNMLPLYFFAERIKDDEYIKNYINLITSLYEDKKTILNIIKKIKVHSEDIEKQLLFEIKNNVIDN